MKTLLTAVDLKPGTENILHQASSLARSLDAELVLVTVEANLPGSEGATDEEALSELTEAFSGDAEKLHEYAEQLQQDGINCRALMLEGTPAKQVLHLADSLAPEMIIIGTHGHSAVFDILAGSAAQDIVQHSNRPVLLVPTS